jgi:hypothetical protein
MGKTIPYLSWVRFLFPIALSFPNRAYSGSYQGIALAMPQALRNRPPFRGWASSIKR